MEDGTMKSWTIWNLSHWDQEINRAFQIEQNYYFCKEDFQSYPEVQHMSYFGKETDWRQVVNWFVLILGTSSVIFASDYMFHVFLACKVKNQ